MSPSSMVGLAVLVVTLTVLAIVIPIVVLGGGASNNDSPTLETPSSSEIPLEDVFPEGELPQATMTMR
jgi:hypothetical protein